VEWGHMPYTEDQYGSGAQGATLYRIGYLTEIRPGFDPELERRYVLREGSEAGRALGVYGGRRMVRLGLTWLQGELADYFQGFALGGGLPGLDWLEAGRLDGALQRGGAPGVGGRAGGEGCGG